MLDNLTDRDRVTICPQQPDPADDGSIFVGVLYALLIEAGMALVVLLMFWMF